MQVTWYLNKNIFKFCHMTFQQLTRQSRKQHFQTLVANASTVQLNMMSSIIQQHPGKHDVSALIVTYIDCILGNLPVVSAVLTHAFAIYCFQMAHDDDVVSILEKFAHDQEAHPRYIVRHFWLMKQGPLAYLCLEYNGELEYMRMGSVKQ